MDYYERGQIIETAVVTGHTLRVEVDNGEMTGTGAELAEDWDALAPGESFTIHAWIGFDGTEHPVEGSWATPITMRMIADMLRNVRGDADAIARAADAFDRFAEERDADDA